MQKGFRRGGKDMFQALGRNFQIAVGTQCGNNRIKLRRGVAVQFRVKIGITEHQAFGDVAEGGIVGK